MMSTHTMEARRRTVLEQLAAIRSLRKGTLSEQWVPVVRDGKKTKELRGPYFVWTSKVGNKTVSERIKGEQEQQWAQQDALNYQRFKKLCWELEDLTHRLGLLERQEGARTEQLKKGLKSPSRKAKKSRG